jgi:hypothetical protein
MENKKTVSVENGYRPNFIMIRDELDLSLYSGEQIKKMFDDAKPKFKNNGRVKLILGTKGNK